MHASTLPRFLARGAAWAPPGPQALSMALRQPRQHCPVVGRKLQSKAVFCTVHDQVKVRHAKARAHRVPVGAKAVMCAAAAGAADSWAETRAYSMRGDGAAISSMHLRSDSGMQQLRVRACSTSGIESRPHTPVGFCIETSWCTA